jgi:leucyl aminopeptidase (aminopeptidase T)
MKEAELIDMLLNYSLELNAGDSLVLDYQKHASKLLTGIRRGAKLRGIQLLEFARPGTITLENLCFLDKLVDRATHYLKIGGGEYHINPADSRLEVEQKEGDIMKKRCALRWAISQYPSEYLAKGLRMSQKDLVKLYFDSCSINLEEQRALQRKIANQLSSGKVEIISPDTNIHFSIIGNPHFCDGRINIPDGEIFYGVNPHSTNGKISFNLPTFFMGSYFDRISLDFLNGKVVNFDSNDNNNLRRLLSLDNFAPFIGEFGIGTNPNAKLVGHSFYDEKVLGTFHLALGAMYPGFESRLHFDLVKKLDQCKLKNNSKGIQLNI